MPHPTDVRTSHKAYGTFCRAKCALSVPELCQRKDRVVHLIVLTAVSKPCEFKSENFHLLANLSSKCAPRFPARSTTRGRGPWVGSSPCPLILKLSPSCGKHLMRRGNF